MKKLEKRYIVIIIVFLVALFLILFSYLIKDNRKLTLAEKLIKDVTISVNKVINMPINYIEDKVKEEQAKNKIYKKYKKLAKKYEKVELMEAKYEEAEKEINDLKKTLNLNKTLSESSYINATVVVRNIGYFYNNLTIDKGEVNNVEKNSAVITDDGLIGTISNTSKFNSTVKLITSNDSNNKISVKIKVDEENYVYGILVGYNDKKFIIEGIAENTDIPIGSMVTTTGLGNDFPSGILIGYVDSITKDNFDLARTLLVRSSVNFDDISYVTVLKKNNDSN